MTFKTDPSHPSATTPLPTVNHNNNHDTAVPSPTTQPTRDFPDTATPSSEVTIRPQISASDIIFIVGGSASDYIVYLTRESGLWVGYGSGPPEQYLPTETIVDAAVGPNHVLSLTQPGTVYAFGYNRYGQLGIEGEDPPESPVKVPSLDEVQAVAAGIDFSMALRADGSVWGWGLNDDGQLGYATPSYRAQPAQVAGIFNVTAISSGGRYTLALRNDGIVFAWGANDTGQLGDGTSDAKSEPVQVEVINNIVAVAAGIDHGLALKDDGTVWSWGANDSGQLGVQIEDPFTASPLQVPSLSNIVAISAGRRTSFALSEDGILWAWGANDFGQLGIGNTEASFTPARVPELTDVTAVATGRQHTIVLQRDDALWGWGDLLLLPGVEGDGVQAYPTRISIEVSP